MKEQEDQEGEEQDGRRSRNKKEQCQPCRNLVSTIKHALSASNFPCPISVLSYHMSVVSSACVPSFADSGDRDELGNGWMQRSSGPVSHWLRCPVVCNTVAVASQGDYFHV